MHEVSELGSLSNTVTIHLFDQNITGLNGPNLLIRRTKEQSGSKIQLIVRQNLS